jgi:hypothetical protein
MGSENLSVGGYQATPRHVIRDLRDHRRRAAIGPHCGGCTGLTNSACNPRTTAIQRPTRQPLPSRRLRARPQRAARRPDLFIAGGGISRKADKWLPLLTNRTPVVAAALQNTAGIVGAAVAAQVDRAESARSGRSECTLSLQ